MFIPIALHKTPRPPENQIHPPVSAFHTANTTHRATARSRSSTIFTVPNLLPPSISPQSYIHVLSVYLKRNEPRAAHPKKAGNHPVCPINPSAPCSHLAPPELDQSTYTVSRLSTLEVVHRKQSIQYPPGRGKYIPHSLWAGPSHPVFPTLLLSNGGTVRYGSGMAVCQTALGCV